MSGRFVSTTPPTCKNQNKQNKQNKGPKSDTNHHGPGAGERLRRSLRYFTGYFPREVSAGYSDGTKGTIQPDSSSPIRRQRAFSITTDRGRGERLRRPLRYFTGYLPEEVIPEYSDGTTWHYTARFVVTNGKSQWEVWSRCNQAEEPNPRRGQGGLPRFGHGVWYSSGNKKQ